MTLDSIRSLVRRFYHWALLLFSGLLLSVGLGFDLGAPGRGLKQNLLVAIGILLIGVVALAKSGRFRSRILLSLITTYITLVGCELAVRIAWPPPPPAWKQYHHINKADSTVGYTLTPNWRGQFNDGYAHGNVAVNSLGHRDDEPSTSSKLRILLLGDSYTFGSLLDQSETIDKKIERLSPDIDAYNLGVGGYGLPAIVETLRRCDLPAHDAFYLFFSNDLREDSLITDNGRTVLDGHLVPKRKPGGTLYSEPELRQKIAQSIEEQEKQNVVVDPKLFILPRIRQLIGAAGKRYFGSVELSERKSPFAGDPSKFSDETVRIAILHTQELRRLATARGMAFHVVIIPTFGEVQAQEYAWPTARYIKELENQNVEVVQLIQSLTEENYFRHDLHLSPSGAQVAAEAINRKLANLRKRFGT